MWRAALLLTLLLAPGVSPAAEERRVLSDLEAFAARRLFAQLLLKATAGMSDFERAAFVVREPDGALSLVHWPSTGELRRGRFYGRIPDEAVAVVHTHPYKLPRPSYQDERECQRTGLVFLVLSREAIWKIDPNDGSSTPMTRSSMWWRDALRERPEEPRRASLDPAPSPEPPSAAPAVPFP